MKKLLSIFSVMMILLLTGCSHIEDSNGADDYNIVSITNDKILGVNSYVANTYIENRKEKTINGFKVITGTVKCSKFSGVRNVETIYCKNGSFEIEIQNTVNGGNFEIVIVRDDEILDIFNANETKILNYNNSSEKYYIKVVGESSNFSLTYKITIGND